MTKNVSAAFRHIGIALIDLEYAILELSQSSHRAKLRGLHDAPLNELICERDRLYALSQRLVALAQDDPPDTSWAHRWWPGFARSIAPGCEINPSQSSDPAL